MATLEEKLRWAEEDDVEKVQRIKDVTKSFAPDYDVEVIYKKLME